MFIKSNVTIEMEEGAVILGSLNFYDYRPDDKRESFVFDSVENLKVF